MTLLGVPWSRWVPLASGALIVTGDVAGEVRHAVAQQSAVQRVMTVNGHEVGGEEFRWYMALERAEVFRHFKNSHGLDEGKDFWSRRVKGTTPRAMLESNTVARVVREKSEQILFLELGLAQDIRYATFLDELEKLNQEREQAAKLGRPVYGPVRYTQLQFYQHLKATLRAQAKEKLAEKQWAPTAEELRKFYDEHRALFRSQPSSTLEVVTVRAQNEAEADAVWPAAEGVLAKLKVGSALSDVLKAPPPDGNISISGRRFEEINGDRLGELFPAEGQLKSVMAMDAGDAVLLMGSDGDAKVIRCLARKAGEVRPYEAAQRQVRERWLDQQYERNLDRLIHQAKVEVNPEALDVLLP